ncbi:hypothetical protein [Psychroflexus aestuariivivens]|uniref:hypothetical protein n=1 Tax=Psychroflexus aestuariivivens TaxID=1795040 RepID=UPI000FD8FF4E|nr:hypothetical protein [Psychroflexus aestuariivivens]
MRKITIILLICILSACEKDCKLERIDENIFDLRQLKEKYFLTSDSNEIDSLIISTKIDIYEKTSFQSPMNYRECEHFKSYKIEFRNEVIDISLRKTDKGIFELDALFWCGESLNQIEINPTELIMDKEYVFNRKTDCEMRNSQIETIILNGFKIKTLKTTDNKTWNLAE